jgi:competence protein ComEC
MANFTKRASSLFLIALLVATLFIWYAVFQEDRRGVLTVAMLDIGQGDAIFIEAPNGNQLMVDGGPPKTVLRTLPKMMPFYDRSLDMLLVTNPDTDHMGGFIDLLKNYKVESVVEPGTKSPTATYAELERAVEKEGAKKIIARRGMKIFLDDDVYLDILFPDRDVSAFKTNDGSIVARLVYGETSFMLTGDAPSGIERYLVSVDGAKLKSDVLKVGHHGSRTSTSPEFVGFVSPTTAIISDGKDNKYGHPHKETLDTLEKFGVKVLRTDQIGTIILRSDGHTITISE